MCAIDQPEYCDVINVAVYSKGALKIMVSTDGVSPSLAKAIRQGIEAGFKDVPLEEYLGRLKVLREKLEKEVPDSDERIGRLIDAVKGFDIQVKVHLPLK